MRCAQFIYQAALLVATVSLPASKLSANDSFADHKRLHSNDSRIRSTHQPSPSTIRMHGVEPVDINALDPDYWTQINPELRPRDQGPDLDEFIHEELSKDKSNVPVDSTVEHNPLFTPYWSSVDQEKIPPEPSPRPNFKEFPNTPEDFLKKVYDLDEPGRPLKPRPEELVSPAPGLPRKYFNVSNYRPWRPSHDAARPASRAPWTDPSKSAYCLLGGIGKREVAWHPQFVKDFFHKDNVHYQWNQEPKNKDTPALLNFLQKNLTTQKWTSHTIFLATSHAREKPIDGDRVYEFLKKTDLRWRRQSWRHVNDCRRYCETCFDAAEETGAETFVCSREEGGGDLHHPGHTLGSSGVCRIAMLTSDPIGRDNICTFHYDNRGIARPRRCGSQHSMEFAYPGAVANPHVSLDCVRVDPCEGPSCRLDETNLLIAEGMQCSLATTVPSRNAGQGYNQPRYGLFGHPTLASAMNDSSLVLYYNTVNPDPGSLEKAWFLGSRYVGRNNWWGDWQEKHFTKDRWKFMFEEYGRWWLDFKAGEPVIGYPPWKEQDEYNLRYAEDLYKGLAGFGTPPGGIFLNASDPR